VEIKQIFLQGWGTTQINQVQRGGPRVKKNIVEKHWF